LKSFYINHSKIKFKRRKKPKEEIGIPDHELSETTFVNRWGETFGVETIIVAKLIYIRASKQKDLITFNFFEFID
jgi:hypothetical protein